MFSSGAAKKPKPTKSPTGSASSIKCNAKSLSAVATVQPVLTIVASGSGLPKGYSTTVRLDVAFRPSGRGGGPKLGSKPGVYAMYGHAKTKKTLTVAAAYQAPRAGSTIGGVLPALIKQIAVLKYDSWLTIGETAGDKNKKLNVLENYDK